MKRFWISWYQQTEDHRPLVFPPTEGVLAWWCSGHSERGDTLVSLVQAEDEEGIPEVLEPNWTKEERSDFRFVEEVDSDWRPSNRFPLSEWMKERIN